jgi:molybdopterin molybdotransferase
MLIGPQTALGIVLKHVLPLTSKRISLKEALGHCLAEDIRADRDLPPADRSAMDGYAVRASDLSEGSRRLRLVGEVPAGSANRPKVTPGTCVRILTGGSVPPGADAVVMVEETKEADGFVIFLKETTHGANIRKQGEEIKKSQVILTSGTVLGPTQIGLCASVGKAVVKVHQRPTPTILCTGRELQKPEARVRAYQLRDSNGPSLRAALNSAGYDKVANRIVPDDPKVLAAKLKTVFEKYNPVIVTGGVSVGKYDYVPEAVKRIGATIRFHGVLMKPGKPQLYATLSRNRHIFALPGNPLSVMTGLYEFVLPAIRRMSGLPAKSCQPSLRLPLAQSIHPKGTRAEFRLGRLVHGESGTRVHPVNSHGSADLAAGAKADGVIVTPKDVREVRAGELVEFRPWSVIL